MKGLVLPVPKIVITEKNNQEIDILPEEKFLFALRRANIAVKSSCNAQGSCGDCVIKVTHGINKLSRPTFNETRLLGNVFHITKERLSCQCFLENIDSDNLELKDEKIIIGKIGQ